MPEKKGKLRYQWTKMAAGDIVEFSYKGQRKNARRSYRTELILSEKVMAVRKDGKKVRLVLSYVPSTVFPAIIFPAVFFNDNGYFVDVNDPKIFGILAAIIIGFFSRNIIATIISGLSSTDEGKKSTSICSARIFNCSMAAGL